MIAAVYARKSTEQTGVADEQKSVRRLVQIIVGLVLAVGIPASAQLPRGRIIGTVEIPALHDSVNKGSMKTGVTAVTLYSEPTDGASAAVVIRNREEIASVEHASEQVSAGVLEIRSQGRARWYRVQYKAATQEGAAWLSSRDAGQFRALSTILIGKLGFFTNAWDHVLYEAPRRDATRRTMSNVRAEEQHLVIAAFDGDTQNLWMLVVLTDGSICDRGSRAVIAAGWIPAYSTIGDLTAWFYARGC